MTHLVEKSTVLREFAAKRAIKVAGTMCDLATAKADFFA
jgi:hypothetical protein